MPLPRKLTLFLLCVLIISNLRAREAAAVDSIKQGLAEAGTTK